MPAGDGWTGRHDCEQAMVAPVGVSIGLNGSVRIVRYPGVTISWDVSWKWTD